MGGPGEPVKTEEGPPGQRARLGPRPGDEKHAGGASGGGYSRGRKAWNVGVRAGRSEASPLVLIKSSGGRGGPRASDPREACGQAELVLEVFIDQVKLVLILKSMRTLLGKEMKTNG